MASLWDQFTDTLSRGFDQVNPFDNGKDWNNRVGNPVIKKKRDEPVLPNMGNGPLRIPLQPQVKQPERPAFQAPKPVTTKDFGTVGADFVNKQAAPKVAADGAVVDTRPYPARIPNDSFADANKALRVDNIVKGSNSSASAAQQLRAEMQQPAPNKARIQALTQQVRQNAITKQKADRSWEGVRQVADTIATPVKVIDEVMRTTGQAINSTPEVIARSLFAEPLSGNVGRRPEDAVDTSGKHTNPVAEYLFGKEVKSYQGQARDMQIAAQNSDNEIIKGAAPYAPFVAPILGALDLAGVKGGKMINDALPVTPGKVRTKSPEIPVIPEKVPIPEQAMAQVVEAPTRGVIQVINNQTGTKRYITPDQAEYTKAVKTIDNQRIANGDSSNGAAGVVQDNGDIFHVTARTPAEMEARGFTRSVEAPRPKDGLSDESKTILTRLDDEIKKEDDIIRQEAAFEIERLQEIIMDPMTPDAQIPILTKQVLDVKDQMARVNSDKATPIQEVIQDATTAPTKRDTTLDGLKVDPNTTTRDRDGNLVDVNTGEILEGVNVPAKPKTAVEYAAQKLDELAPELKADTRPLPERVTSLPDKTAARIEDMPVIEQTKKSIDAELDTLKETTTPKQRSLWAREMAQNGRDGSPLSSESKAIQDQVQELMDAFYSKSGRSLGDARKDGQYLPQATPQMLESREVTEFGSSFIDSVNSKFGFAETRKDAIELDDLADPIDTLKSYNEQWHYDNYGHLKQAQKLADKGYIKPVEYLKAKEELADTVAASVDSEIAKQLSRKPGKVKTVTQKQAHKVDVLKEIQQNFDAHGNPAEVRTSDVQLPTAANMRTTRELWKRTGIYKESGMNRYDNANGQGEGVFEEIGGAQAIDNLKAGGNWDSGRAEYISTVKGTYEAIYKQDFTGIMDEYQFNEMVATAASKAYYFTSPQPLKSLERSLAGEKILHFAERTRFTDKAVTKKFKNEVEYILRDSRRAKSLSDNVTNFLTSMYHTGALGLNPQSAVQQISEIARVYGVGGGKNTIKGIYEAVKTMKPHEIRKFLDSYGVQDSYSKQMMNKADDQIRTMNSSKMNYKTVAKIGNPLKKVAKAYDWVQEGTMKGFNAFETAKDVTLLKTLELKHAGILDPYARRTAVLDEFNRTALKGGHFGAIEATNRSNIARLGLQFGQYTMKDWGLMGEMARKGNWGYVTRTIGGKAATAVPLYTLFGTSVAFTLGLSEYKGGPAIGLATLTMTEMYNEDVRAKEAAESGKGDPTFNWGTVRDNVSKKQGAMIVPGGNYLFNKLGVQELLPGLKDASFLRDDTALSDRERGYNQAQKGYNDDGKGNARFAAADDPWNKFKALIGGAYNTDEAHEYFDNGFFDLQFWGAKIGNDPTLRPVGEKYQDKISAIPDKDGRGDAKAVGRIIDESREQQAERKFYFDQHPDLKEAWDAMNKTTWNRETQKNESDTISPERWKTVLGSKDGQMFNYMRDRAERANKDFGDPIDPLYLLKDQGQINDVLTIRAAFTGDDKEKKSTLKEQEWYTKYSDDLSKYYDEKGTQAQDPNSDFGSTEKAQQYYELSQQNPYVTIPASPARTKYEEIKASGDDAARKAFYKANADVLSAEYEGLSKATFDWTNKMRTLEGAAPLTAEVWNNDTYGYTSDGVLDGKNTKYEKGAGSGYAKTLGSKRIGFGGMGDGGTAEMKKVKVASVKRKVRTRGGSKAGKITFKRSKTV